MDEQPQTDAYLGKVTEMSLKTPTDAAAILMLANAFGADADMRPLFSKIDKPVLFVGVPSKKPQGMRSRRSCPPPASNTWRAPGALFVDQAEKFNALLEAFARDTPSRHWSVVLGAWFLVRAWSFVRPWSLPPRTKGHGLRWTRTEAQGPRNHLFPAAGNRKLADPDVAAALVGRDVRVGADQALARRPAWPDVWTTIWSGARPLAFHALTAWTGSKSTW